MPPVRSDPSEDRRLAGFAGRAIGLNRIFASLPSLLFRTRLLALNAEIAGARVGETGAAFGVVVKELVVMGGELRRVTDDLEALFGEVARHVGDWIRARNRFSLYLRVIDALNLGAAEEGAETVSVAERSLLDGRVLEDAAAQSEACGVRPSLERSWRLALERRDDALRQVDAIDDCCRRLLRLVERLGFVATRQSGYLATTARIESTHADQAAFDLSGVTGDIEELARDFSALQHAAGDAVRAAAKEAERIASRSA